MAQSASLIALTLQFCQWQPAEIPALYILEDRGFKAMRRFTAAQYRQPLQTRHEVMGFYDSGSNTVFINSKFANERVLCHEWRHAVEGSWHN